MSKDKAAFPKISGLGGEDGMSLCDYFAAKAMQALIETIGEHDVTAPEEIVSAAYTFADAMLKAREEWI